MALCRDDALFFGLLFFAGVAVTCAYAVLHG